MSRRVASRVALCLFAGAVTGLGIAWACAWFRLGSTGSDSLLISVDSHRDTWMGWRERGPGWSTHMLYGAEGWTVYDPATMTNLPRWLPTPREGKLETRAIAVVGAGWPMTCVVASCEGLGHLNPPPGGAWHTGLGPQWVEWREWRSAIGGTDTNGPTAPPYQKVLPYGIVPLGTIVNLAFWSMLWTIPFALLALRAWRRKRRGCCAACGYDLRGANHAACPECGSVAPR